AGTTGEDILLLPLDVIQDCVIKKVPARLFIESRPLVRDLHAQHAHILVEHIEARLNPYFTGITELDRVADQVVDHLHDTFAIATQTARNVSINSAGQLQSLFLRDRAKGIQALLHGMAQVKIIFVEGNAAAEDTAVIEYVINQRQQQLARLVGKLL